MDNCCKLNIISDMDEILYKEYERRNRKESSEQNPITKDIVENNAETTKQEFQTITLNGIEYHLIPKEISDEFKDMIKKANKEDFVEETIEDSLKRKFETNEYICIMRDIKLNNWVINKDPSFYQNEDNTIEYKLIKKEHKEIVEAHLKDKNVKIEFTNYIPKEVDIWYIEEDFIERYDEDYEYRIAKKEFEPFTLNIEVNTIDEAKSLWNRFNLNYNTLCKSMGSRYYNVELQNIINDIKYWKQLDDILKDLGESLDTN